MRSKVENRIVHVVITPYLALFPEEEVVIEEVSVSLKRGSLILKTLSLRTMVREGDLRVKRSGQTY